MPLDAGTGVLLLMKLVSESSMFLNFKAIFDKLELLASIWHLLKLLLCSYAAILLLLWLFLQIGAKKGRAFQFKPRAYKWRGGRVDATPP